MRSDWEKKPIPDGLKAPRQPQTPDAHAAVKVGCPFATPSPIAIYSWDVLSRRPCSKRFVKFVDFNIRLNAVVQLKPTGVGSRTRSSSSRRSAIYASIASSVNTPPASGTAVRVQRVQRFFQRTRYPWDLFRFRRQAWRCVLSMASPGESYSLIPSRPAISRAAKLLWVSRRPEANSRYGALETPPPNTDEAERAARR